jgi:hypothetical protein
MREARGMDDATDAILVGASSRIGGSEAVQQGAYSIGAYMTVVGTTDTPTVLDRSVAALVARDTLAARHDAYEDQLRTLQATGTALKAEWVALADAWEACHPEVNALGVRHGTCIAEAWDLFQEALLKAYEHDRSSSMGMGTFRMEQQSRTPKRPE